jgi:hypothetical protein
LTPASTVPVDGMSFAVKRNPVTSVLFSRNCALRNPVPVQRGQAKSAARSPPLDAIWHTSMPPPMQYGCMP